MLTLAVGIAVGVVVTMLFVLFVIGGLMTLVTADDLDPEGDEPEFDARLAGM